MQIMKSIVEGAQRDQWLRIWLECMNQIVCRCGDLLFYARIIRRITFREALTDLKWLYHSTSFGIHCNAVVTSQCQLNDVSKLTMSDIQRVLHPSTSSAIKIHQLFSITHPINVFISHSLSLTLAYGKAERWFENHVLHLNHHSLILTCKTLTFLYMWLISLRRKWIYIYLVLSSRAMKSYAWSVNQGSRYHLWIKGHLKWSSDQKWNETFNTSDKLNHTKESALLFNWLKFDDRPMRIRRLLSMDNEIRICCLRRVRTAKLTLLFFQMNYTSVASFFMWLAIEWNSMWIRHK